MSICLKTGMFSTGYVFDESLLNAFKVMSKTNMPIKSIELDLGINKIATATICFWVDNEHEIGEVIKKYEFYAPSDKDSNLPFEQRVRNGSFELAGEYILSRSTRSKV
jgi:hypothetical protein